MVKTKASEIMTAVDAQKVKMPEEKKKQKRISQNDCPLHTLEEALKIPQAIKDNYAGQATDPFLVAAACGYSPSSSLWRSLTGAAIAYGLTEGGYNSKTIAITPLAERIVAPIIDGDALTAMQEASLRPSVLKSFFLQYDRNRFPREDIAKNVLATKKIQQDRLAGVYKIIRDNGKFTNTIQVLSGSEYVRLSTDNTAAAFQSQEVTVFPQATANNTDDVFDIPQELADRMNISAPAKPAQDQMISTLIPRVFISHGRESKLIVGQLKELLSYGQMEPVITVEREATAVPVPEKVFEDMRSCSAGIIHACLETVVIDDNAKYDKLNENVLIEIGAAMALYGKRIIILCKKGTILPSNLQGLYRCEYDSDQLDYTATMKLLKTLQELRKLM